MRDKAKNFLINSQVPFIAKASHKGVGVYVDSQGRLRISYKPAHSEYFKTIVEYREIKCGCMRCREGEWYDLPEEEDSVKVDIISGFNKIEKGWFIDEDKS